jgi:hypothetical protein
MLQNTVATRAHLKSVERQAPYGTPRDAGKEKMAVLWAVRGIQHEPHRARRANGPSRAARDQRAMTRGCGVPGSAQSQHRAAWWARHRAGALVWPQALAPANGRGEELHLAHAAASGRGLKPDMGVGGLANVRPRPHRIDWTVD